MKNNKGFSLVELIVVIAIMAILAAVAVVSFNVYIQKAKDANDNEYRSNVEYFAMLEATEHQFELIGDKVVLENIVDGPEDIKLVIKKPTGQVDTVVYDPSKEDDLYNEVILDIYNAVGDWTFSYACDHEGATIAQVEACCVDGKYLLYSCCGHKEYISRDLDHDNHKPITDEDKKKAMENPTDDYYYIHCDWCGSDIPYSKDGSWKVVSALGGSK